MVSRYALSWRRRPSRAAFAVASIPSLLTIYWHSLSRDGPPVDGNIFNSACVHVGNRLAGRGGLA
jgi:hypothetical protein